MPNLPPDQDIASPCVRNCCLDDDDICLGCGRSLREITQWSAASKDVKQMILLAADQRRQLMQLRRQVSE